MTCRRTQSQAGWCAAPAAMVTLLKRRDEAERRLAKAEAHWLQAQSALDAVQ